MSDVFLDGGILLDLVLMMAPRRWPRRLGAIYSHLDG